MEPDIKLDLNDIRIVRDKQDRDVLLALLFGASAVLSLTLTALIGTSFLQTKGRTTAFWLIALTLIGSVACCFAGKRNERWYVLCSLLNHMGIGLGLFVLLLATDAVVRPVYLAVSGLPACICLCGVCLLFRGLDGNNRIRTVVIGAVVLGILAIVSIVMAVKTLEELWIGSAISSVTCCATCCGMAWSASKSDRSVYWTMAAVSFAVYLLVLLIAAAALIFAAAANSGGDSGRKSGRNEKNSKRNTSMRGTRFRGGSWFYYPLFMSGGRSTGARGYGADAWHGEDSGQIYESYETYRNRDRKNLRILLAVLLALFTAVLILAVVVV